MRTASLLLLTIGWAAWMQATGYAVPSKPASQQSSPESAAKTVSDTRDSGKPTGERNPRHVSEKGHQHNSASLSRETRPKQLANNRQRSRLGNAMTVHQPGSTQSGGASKDRSIQNEKLSNTRSVRPPGIVTAARPSPNSVRHRGSNPATVGAANSVPRNSGAINGSRMTRKP
jgi:hypothetical protein